MCLWASPRLLAKIAKNHMDSQKTENIIRIQLSSIATTYTVGMDRQFNAQSHHLEEKGVLQT